MATVMMQPNVVVGPPPDPPGYYPNYASRSSLALGGIQIGIGVLSVVLTIIVLASKPRHEESVDFGYIFMGILYIAAGSCGVAAGKVKMSCQIIAFMVLSIIAAVCAVPDFIIAAAVPTDTHYKGMIYILAVLFLFESVASIWSAAICCRSVCCGRRRTTTMPDGYQAQTGQVVMVMANPAQMPQQPVQGMAPAPSAPYAFQGATAAYTGNQVSYEELPPKY